MRVVLTQAVRAVYREAHENDVSVWIGERSQPVIVLLTSCVPESQLHLSSKHIKVTVEHFKCFTDIIVSQLSQMRK